MNSFKIFLAKYLFIAVVLVVAWVWFKQNKNKKMQMAAAVIGAGVLALIISRIAAKLYYDPRPFVTKHIQPLIPHSADNGFPSDHALLTATLSGVIYAYSKKWSLIAFAGAILVGAGRVLVHVHSPIDIIGSFAIGIVSAWVAVMLARKYMATKQVSSDADQKDGQ